MNAFERQEPRRGEKWHDKSQLCFLHISCNLKLRSGCLSSQGLVKGRLISGCLGQHVKSPGSSFDRTRPLSARELETPQESTRIGMCLWRDGLAVSCPRRRPTDDPPSLLTESFFHLHKTRQRSHLCCHPLPPLFLHFVRNASCCLAPTHISRLGSSCPRAHVLQVSWTDHECSVSERCVG